MEIRSAEEIAKESFEKLKDVISDPEIAEWYIQVAETCMVQYASQVNKGWKLIDPENLPEVKSLVIFIDSDGDMSAPIRIQNEEDRQNVLKWRAGPLHYLTIQEFFDKEAFHHETVSQYENYCKDNNKGGMFLYRDSVIDIIKNVLTGGISYYPLNGQPRLKK